MLAVFRNTYRPLLNDPALCARCHTESGRSPIKFAHSNESIAYNEFMNVGVDMVDANATDGTHAPGVTSPALQPRITAIRPTFDAGFEEYVYCRNQGGGSINTSVHTTDKLIPELYFGDGRTPVTVSWYLNSTEAMPAGGRFPAQLAMDVQIDYEMVSGVDTPVGYTFTNPRLRMLTGETEVEIEGVIVRINGVDANNIEPFLSARKVVRGIDYIRIFSGSVNAPLSTVSSSDRFSLALGYLQIRPRTDNPPTPPTPNISVGAFTNQTTVGVNISNDGTGRLWCLTSISARPQSTAAPCPGSTITTNNGWSTTRPNNFNLANIGHPVVSGETVQMYLWVANSDLKVNATAGTASVTFDNTLPAAPALTSVTITDTQIADLNGVGDSNEPVEWCVKEASQSTSVQNDGGCSYGPTKPTMIGLKGNGNRFVAVFVRDRAGNRSQSPIRQVNNTLGRITFQQLTTGSFGNRAVFMTNCQTCHGAGMAQQSRWDESSYSDTVAKKTQIRNRINSTTAPMPPAGQLPVRQRMLIELWFDQTTTPVEL